MGQSNASFRDLTRVSQDTLARTPYFLYFMHPNSVLTHQMSQYKTGCYTYTVLEQLGVFPKNGRGGTRSIIRRMTVYKSTILKYYLTTTVSVIKSGWTDEEVSVETSYEVAEYALYAISTKSKINCM